jgi:hypothetical protein
MQGIICEKKTADRSALNAPCETGFDRRTVTSALVTFKISGFVRNDGSLVQIRGKPTKIVVESRLVARASVAN